MAQYTPRTWTTGDTITAAELNALEAAAAAAAVKADADAAYDAKGAATTAQAAAVQRANHTGTQAASTITGLGAAVAADPAAVAAFGRLIPTATKTANYTAVVGDEAVMDLTSGPLTVTLPTAPANGSIVGVRALNATATNPLTVARGGTDTVGTAGATTATLPLAGEVTVFRYDAAATRWLAVANVKPLTALDSRYPLAATLGASVAADATVKGAFESRTATVSIARDAAGRISSVTQDGVTESYTRDAAGRVATLTVGGVTRIVTRTPAGAVSGVA